MTEPAFQDLMPHNHCWGCGPDNPKGLHIKSYWEGDEAVCRWHPQPWHMAGPTHILNGGIIATIVDCHSICTAIADAARCEGRGIESEPVIWYVTGKLDLTYLKPTPIAGDVVLRARVTERKGRKSIVACTVEAEGEERARAETVAIRVPDEWRAAS